MSPLEIINTVKPFIKIADAKRAADALGEKATKMWLKYTDDKDDITVIVIFILDTLCKK